MIRQTLILLLTSVALVAQDTGYNLRIYSNIVDMLSNAHPRSANRHAYVLGYHSPGDGGGGVFCATNVITSTNRGKRFVSYLNATNAFDRLVAPNEPINVRWFGSKGDGVTDDSAALTAAIAALPATGGKILIDQMLGISNGVTITSRSNIVIQGAGASAGFKALAPSAIQIPTTIPIGTVLAVTGCQNITITDLTFDGGGLATKQLGMQNTTDSVVTRCTFRNWSSTAVNARPGIGSFGGSRNTYSHNYIYGSTGAWAMGMYIGNTNPGEVETDSQIHDNVIYDVSWDGIVGTLSGGRIYDNTIIDPAASGIALGTAAEPYDYKRTIISGNKVRGAGYHGIQADSVNAAHYVRFITVTDNLLEECNYNGIYVVRAKDWLIKGNTCRNNNFNKEALLATGIYVDDASDIVVDGNICSDDRSGTNRTQVAGIAVNAQVGDISRVTVNGNQARNNTAHGIYVANVDPKKVDTVGLSGNGAFNNSQWGVLVAHTTDGMITNCFIGGTSAYGNGTGAVRADPTDIMIADQYLGYTSKDLHGVGFQSEHPHGVYVRGTVSYFTSGLSQFSGVLAVGNGVINYSVVQTNGDAYFKGGSSFAIGTDTAHFARAEVQSSSNYQLNLAYNNAVKTLFHTSSNGVFTIIPDGGTNVLTGDVVVTTATPDRVAYFDSQQRLKSSTITWPFLALTDGNKGDITVSGSGSVFTINPNVVTYSKIQDVSAGSRLVGRGATGAGDPEEIQLGAGLLMTGNVLSVSGSSSGEVNDGLNLGTGTHLYAGKAGVSLQFNSVAAGTGVTLSSNANTLTFSSTGEANTASTLGGGTAVYDSKSGVDLRFRSLAGTNGLGVSASGGVVTVALVVTNSTMIMLDNPSVVATAGENRNYWRADRYGTIKAAYATVLTASSSGSVTLDLKKNGTTVLTAPVSIATSGTTATATLSGTVTFVPGDFISGDVDSPGTGSKGPAIQILYTSP